MSKMKIVCPDSHRDYSQIEVAALVVGRVARMRETDRLRQRGFTLIEIAFVLTISFIIVGFALPNYLTMQQGFRTSGDSRNLTGMVAEAKMRAAASFTHARVYANLSSGTYHLEVWNKTGNGGAGCWQTDGDTNACTTTSSPVEYLSSKVSFSYGSIGTPPSNTQTTIGQAPLCFTGYAGESTNTVSTANTACIEFNSRGVPSDPDPGGSAGAAGGVPDATGALYVTDGTSVYAVTVIATGSRQTWYSANKATPSWQQR
jgi:prepilin-type N-terminal cleavage/methylation domain-containing protein